MIQQHPSTHHLLNILGTPQLLVNPFQPSTSQTTHTWKRLRNWYPPWTSTQFPGARSQAGCIQKKLSRPLSSPNTKNTFFFGSDHCLEICIFFGRMELGWSFIYPLYRTLETATKPAFEGHRHRFLGVESDLSCAGKGLWWCGAIERVPLVLRVDGFCRFC